MDAKEFERQFESLSGAIEEPILKEVRSRVRQINEGFTLTSLDTEEVFSEAQRLTSELDEIVQPFMGKYLTYTGKVRFLGNDEDGTPFVFEKFVEDSPAVFHGFVPSVDSIGDSEFVKIRHCLKVPVSSLNGSEDFSLVSATGDPESSMEFEAMTSDRAMLYLNELHPDIVNIIDHTLLGESGEDESEALLRLKNLDLDISSHEDEPTLSTALGVYLNYSLNIDEDSMYACTMNGTFYAPDLEGDLVEYAFPGSEELLYKIGPVAFYDISSEKYVMSNEGYELLVEVRLIDGDHNRNKDTLFVPVESIESMYSLRHRYYSN